MNKLKVFFILFLIVAIGFGFIRKSKPIPLAIYLPEYVKKSFHSPNFPNNSNPATQEGFELGKRLFYDVQLSKSKTISCASCHVQALAFSDTAQFSKGMDDVLGDRNSMTLANIGWSSRFFWDGRAALLKDQIHDPIIDKREMGNTWADVIDYVKSEPIYQPLFKKAFPKQKTIDEQGIKNALEQFVSSIYSFQSRYDDYTYNFNRKALNEQELLGLKLFNSKAQCGNCHNSVLLSNHQFMNNGLDATPNIGLYNATANPSDKGLMKTPSLRNVAITPPYMHDGRFKNLDEVLNFYNTQVAASSPNIDFRMDAFIKPGGLGLTNTEIAAIKAFLHTLTDSTLLNNPVYHNPWTANTQQ